MILCCQHKESQTSHRLLHIETAYNKQQTTKKTKQENRNNRAKNRNKKANTQGGKQEGKKPREVKKI